MHDPEQSDGPEAANIRFLRRMTTVLTGVMILGLLTMIALFVIRFWGGGPAPDMAQGLRSGALPPAIVLPEGETVLSVTHAPGWIGVIFRSGRMVFYAPDGSAMHEVTITLPEGQ